MKRLKRPWKPLLAALVVLSMLAPLAGVAQAQDYKVGLVITQKLLAMSEIGQSAAKELQGKKKTAQEKLDRKATEIKELQEDLVKRVMVLSDEEKQKARDEFERQQRDAARMKEDLERELQKAENDVLAGVNEFLTKIIVEYGEANGYDIVLDATAALYFSDEPDITDDLVTAADAAYKKRE